MDLSSGTIATGGELNVGAASFAAGGCDGPASGALDAGAAALDAAGGAGGVVVGVDGAIGFWALLADAKNAAVVASTISVNTRSTVARQNVTGQSRERFVREFIAGCISHMSRKLRII
jgi:hypothetical protein